MTDLQLKQPREGDRVAYKSDIDGLREYVAGSERRPDEKIDNVANQLSQKLDLKLGALDQKIDNVATRLDQKIDNVATQLNQKLDLKLGALDQKIDNVTAQLDTKIVALDQKLDLRFDSLAKQIQIFSWVGGGIATIMASAILLLISRSL